MRFTSLVIELIRARPLLVVWLVVGAQALLWFVVPMLVYASPPGDVATVLAYGREYQVGTDLGPPLAFWLADLAYRAAGEHIFGVYLLAQICFVVTFVALYRLGRAIAGPQHAVVAVILTSTITAFASDGTAFGPMILARPLWALALLHIWQVIGQGRRNAWFALSLEVGLLLLTTTAAPVLLLLPLGFALATARGRRAFLSLDTAFSVLVIAALVVPYAVWLIRADLWASLSLPANADIAERAQIGGIYVLMLLLSAAGVAVLTLFNNGRFAPKNDDSPVVVRQPVDPLARGFVYVFALGPLLLAGVGAAVFGPAQLAGCGGIALLLTGLAVVVTGADVVAIHRQRLLRSIWAALVVAPAVAVIGGAVVQPWIGRTELPTAIPAKDIARFFGEAFERRTGKPLPAVAGDPELASLVAMGASRPRLLLDATPARTPWINLASFQQTGGIVVWRAADTAGKPPEEIAKRFPDIVPELPRAFDRLIAGRQPLIRIGWAIVRPKTP
ncbi:glycosyltransferase family 39 protein [Rhodopseudomonas sp. B29]|uniref:glycosyltransferase family 39 protein n=1 Tax=Rhodopseudomonas sp. B29 TaxID=95607 RepID=UPI0004CE0909|nr:glycosyltransferase family 39 protein [Rhodopseudomonas sp. B29]